MAILAIKMLDCFWREFNLPEGIQLLSSIGIKNANNAIGGLRLPYGSEVFQQQLWTTDCVNGTVQVFDFNGDLVNTIGGYALNLESPILLLI